MTIDHDALVRDVATLLKSTLETRADENKARAARLGVDVFTYAALTVVQLLADHYGIELGRPDPQAN
jgi:hypothetical protein